MPTQLRVLIVEDTADDADLALLELSRGGFDPISKRVQSAEELREALSEGWNIVLSDYSLPGFAAPEALAVCREVDPDLPFIVVSGTIGENQAVEMMRAGASDYLLKGSLTRLSAAVDRELRDAENRRAKRATDRENMMLRSIIESSPDFIAVSQSDTANGKVIFVNRAGQKLLGLRSDKEVSQTSISDYHAQEEMARFEREIMPILRTGGSVSGEIAFRHFRTGASIPAEWNVFAVPSPEGGSPAFIACVARDISVRKQGEQELRESEQQLLQKTRILKSILDNMGEGVVVVDEEGKFLVFNPAAQQILCQGETNTRPAEWQAQYSLFLPDGKTPFPTEQIPLVKALHGVPSDEIEMIVNHDRAPLPRWISVSARPLLDETGTLRGGICVFRNITERKGAEHAIHISEERYRTLVNAAAAIVWDSPPSGAFDSDQPAWTAFTGQSIAQHRGWGWLNAIHPDDREKSARAWAKAVLERSNYQIEHRVRRADGVYRDMSVRAVPLFGPNGAIREWVGVHTDITDQRRAEVERAELLTRLTIQIERMPLAYLLSGPDFRFVHWNPAAEHMFGFTTAEALGKLPSDLIVPPQSEKIVADIRVRLEVGDMNAHGLCEMVTKDGRPIICEWHNTPLFGLDGAFEGVLAVAQDVTKRQQAEQAVRDTEQRLKRILASSPAILLNLTVEDEQIRGINWISDNIREILGHEPVDTLSPNWWLEHIHPDERGEVVACTHEGLFGPDGRAISEFRFRHRSGQYLWTRSEIQLIRDDVGVAVEAVGAWSDITDRKLLEDQFHQAQKMDAIGQLAGGVAHDFNNLLTIINGYSELLIDRFPLEDPSRGMVVEIYKAGERSAGLTRQLLAFSRQQVLAPRILDLNEVVADTDKMLRRLIGEDVRLTTTLVSQPWPVRADAGQVEQILLNLAVNARDAMPTGGRLTIETRNVELDETYVRTHNDVRAGPHVLLSVSDTGSGMSAEVKAKIFEPFFTTKEVGKGTGLGLATVYGIVKQSGGHVSVYSEIGVGTTFKVYLPRVEPETHGSKSLSRIRKPPRGSETVLLAEDEAGVRTLTRQILIGCGYKVLEAHNGDDAVRLASECSEPIHLMLTDVVMPGMGGRFASEEVAKRHPSLRVLFMSGYTDDAIIRHGVLRDGVNFIQKPFSPVALAIKVREILDEQA